MTTQINGNGITFGDATQQETASPIVAQALHVQDQKASGVDAGAATSGSFQRRELNTIVHNTITGASLNTNLITLPEGSYYIDARVPYYDVGYSAVNLTNNTDSTILIFGTGGFTNITNPSQTFHYIRGYFTLAAEKDIEILHRVGTSKSPDGYGIGANLGQTEVYTDVLIWKVG